MDRYYPDLHHISLRFHRDITSQEAFDKIVECFKKPVKKMEYHYSVAVCREIKANRPHIQAYLVFAMPLKTLRERVRSAFDLKGNADWSFTQVRDRVSYLSYIRKESDYKYTPNLLEEIQNSPEWIETEEDNKNFNEKFKLLSELYLTTELSDYNFLLKLLELYSDYSKNIYIAHIRSQWLGLANQRNKPLNKNGYRVSGNSRPFRHFLIEEVMRGFAVFDN